MNLSPIELNVLRGLAGSSSFYAGVHEILSAHGLGDTGAGRWYDIATAVNGDLGTFAADAVRIHTALALGLRYGELLTPDEFQAASNAIRGLVEQSILGSGQMVMDPVTIDARIVFERLNLLPQDWAGAIPGTVDPSYLGINAPFIEQGMLSLQFLDGLNTFVMSGENALASHFLMDGWRSYYIRDSPLGLTGLLSGALTTIGLGFNSERLAEALMSVSVTPQRQTNSSAITLVSE
jgi:hypothetical protein